MCIPIALAQSATIAQAQSTTKIEKIKWLFRQGFLQYHSKQYETALTSLQAALQLCEEIKDLKWKVTILSQLGTTLSSLSRHSESIAYSTQALSIARTLKDLNQESFILTQLGLSHTTLSEHKTALSYYEQALILYRKLQDQEGESSTLSSRGSANLSLNQYQAAIDDYNQALPILRKLRSQPQKSNDLQLTRLKESISQQQEMLILFNRGIAYSSVAKHKEAIADYNQALPMIEKFSDNALKAELLVNRGIASCSLAQCENAVSDYNQAVQIFRSLRLLPSEANTLMNRGVAYRTLSRYVEAIADYEKALPILRTLKDRKKEASVLSNLGTVYSSLSRHADAIETYNQALIIAREEQSTHTEATLLMNSGVEYFKLSNPEQALRLYRQALPLYQKINYRHGVASVYLNSGNILRTIPQYQNQAIDNYDKARQIYHDLGSQNSEAMAISNIGIVYLELLRHEEANRQFNQALTLYNKTNNPTEKARTLSQLGDLNFAMDRYEVAIEYYNQALPIFQTLQNRGDEAFVLTLMGKTRLKMKQFSQAEQLLRKSIAIDETIRLDRLSEENKISFFDGQSGRYQILQEVLIAQNQPESALVISEWGRSKALIERLNQQLNLQTTTPSNQAPDLATLTQTARSQNSTLIEYSLIQDAKDKTEKLYIWVIQPTGQVSFRQLDLTTALPKHCISIRDLVNQNRKALRVRSDVLISRTNEKSNDNSCHSLDHQGSLTTLHKLLIEPIADLLPTDPTQLITFIPQDELFLVPFSALINSKGQYLIQQHTIRISPSIQLLNQTAALKTKPRGTGAIIVGNPKTSLPALPNAEREAQVIAPLFNTVAITGVDATKSIVLQKMQTVRIIHLATHGTFDPLNGFSSAIYFTPAGQDNGKLTAQEILGLNLNADLAVLSACDTGRGRLSGEGVIGLSRSFIAAGVPSVIVSLWQVPDDSTALLMAEFYNQLKTNPNKAQALRQAMLNTLKQHPEPSSWAAFTIVGEAK